MDAHTLLRIRKNLGLTQEQLAERLGVSKNTIYNYESGSKIPLSKMAMLEGILNGGIVAKIKGDGNTQVVGGVGAMVSGSKISEQDVNALQDRIRSLEDEILKLKGELKAKDELIKMILSK